MAFNIGPTGFSPLADDMVLHSDGPHAIPAMLIGEAYNVDWAPCQYAKICKSVCCKSSDRLSVATDSITVDGFLFRILQQHAQHTNVGVLITLFKPGL